VKTEVKKKTSSPQPPMCLMAKGNTNVCEEDSDSDSDDELDPNEFANLIGEYTAVIKREKVRSRFLRALVSS